MKTILISLAYSLALLLITVIMFMFITLYVCIINSYSGWRMILGHILFWLVTCTCMFYVALGGTP